MKYALRIMLGLCLFAGCKDIVSPIDTVRQYYAALDASDFHTIKEVISDTLTIVEGDYTTHYTQSDFYTQFQWDSTFQTSYSIESIKVDDRVIALISSKSLRYAFLKNNPLVCKYAITTKDEKITKIETLDYVDVDWATWQQERDSLVKWIKVKHPELDGFIHDLTPNGAENYLKAIEMYQRR